MIKTKNGQTVASVSFKHCKTVICVCCLYPYIVIVSNFFRRIDIKKPRGSITKESAYLFCETKGSESKQSLYLYNVFKSKTQEKKAGFYCVYYTIKNAINRYEMTWEITVGLAISPKLALMDCMEQQ